LQALLFLWYVVGFWEFIVNYGKPKPEGCRKKWSAVDLICKKEKKPRPQVSTITGVTV